MIIVLKPEATDAMIEHVLDRVRELGLTPHLSKGQERTIIGVIGDDRILANLPLRAIAGVEDVVPILAPWKLAGREFKKEDTLIEVGGVKIGGRTLAIMAGPCAVEKRELTVGIAQEVKAAGGNILRGGAYKPRTSPYAFQGLGNEGLDYLAEAKKLTGLPIVSEILDPRDIELFLEKTDIIQIGARNMQNFELLKEVGAYDKPVLLKRGLSATIKEWLLSAEYIMSRGNKNVMMCERGIRTFESQYRNTLDLSAIPSLKALTHLPVIVDPSHATGKWMLVAPMAKAAVAAGADGLLIEVHSNPECALCDGEESLKPAKFKDLMRDLRRIAEAVDRKIE
jgi:3-deoxy-7-phosphoheptulonate synthase